MLRELKSRHPRSLIHIAAHSHGGNIVLYAARDPEVAALINSVTCLSTPFLHIAPREFGPWLLPETLYAIGRLLDGLPRVVKRALW